MVSKVFTLIVLALNPWRTSRERWFLRLMYLCNLRQLAFFLNDRIKKEPYKSIAFDGEFAPELKFVLPYAYWHFKNGTLQQTISTSDTRPFYFFSPRHQEYTSMRRWNDFKYDLSIPNSFDHGIKYNYSKWMKVPLKDYYISEKISFQKPTMIISNKYNQEWEGEPINFIGTDTLAQIFDHFKERYQIVYNRPQGREIVEDNSKILPFKDIDLVRSYDEVLYLSDFFEESNEASFNRFQIRIYASCSAFISVQGGNSVLASYFAGQNIIYAKRGLELEMNEYNTIYPRLSGAEIHVVSTAKEIFEKALQIY